MWTRIEPQPGLFLSNTSLEPARNIKVTIDLSVYYSEEEEYIDIPSRGLQMVHVRDWPFARRFARGAQRRPRHLLYVARLMSRASHTASAVSQCLSLVVTD